MVIYGICLRPNADDNSSAAFVVEKFDLHWRDLLHACMNMHEHTHAHIYITCTLIVALCG